VSPIKSKLRAPDIPETIQILQDLDEFKKVIKYLLTPSGIETLFRYKVRNKSGDEASIDSQERHRIGIVAINKTNLENCKEIREKVSGRHSRLMQKRQMKTSKTIDISNKRLENYGDIDVNVIWNGMGV
jgi:hypothetical protein